MMFRHAVAASALLALLAPLTLAACPDDAVPSGTADADAAGPDVVDAGDTASEADAPAPVVFCDGPIAQRYDPLAAEALETWPDDYFTHADPDSPTGLRVDLNADNAPWVADIADLLRGNFESMGALSGFGTSAGLFFRFTEPLGATLPADAEASVSSPALQLIDLDTAPPTRVPYEAWLGDEGKDIILWPLRPLRRGHLHAAVVTTDLATGDGGCVAPSPTLRALLTGAATDASLSRLHGRYATLLARTGLDPGSISAATVFTTHDDLSVVVAAADDVRTHDFAWKDAPVCTDQGALRRCEGTFVAYDYRDDRYVATPTPKEPWTLPVSVWLPPAGTPGAPWPVAMFGHGLSSSRNGGKALAQRVVPMGMAVVAADAVVHGDHPTAEGLDPQFTALTFLGIDLDAVVLDALALRGNFNQTVLDRLQLVELLRDAPDVDGDGAPDLDTSRMAYHGISMGGMLGSGLLATSDAFQAGILSVAGGRLMTFATDTEQVKAFEPILFDLVGGEAEFERLLAVAQALVDAGDPASFGPHILRDRFVGDAPDVLFQVATGDVIVPPSAGRALARAMDIPHVGEHFQPVALIPEGPALPASGDLAEGTLTAGYFQFDRVSAGAGAEEAGHHNTVFSAEGEAQILHFLQTWLDTGLAEILDPYDELGTPPL